MRKKLLVVKPKGKRPPRRPRQRWEIILQWVLKKQALRMWI
jgi:hypothetical protein